MTSRYEMLRDNILQGQKSEHHHPPEYGQQMRWIYALNHLVYTFGGQLSFHFDCNFDVLQSTNLSSAKLPKGVP